ncbi:MAG: FHIPEP family type III secretion protein [Candidatus Accumulibacter sp.]|nr:FHIPEP family type III secretion protein [Accumulibacter sp.]
MSKRSQPAPTQLLLSFSSAYGELAQRVASELRAAGLSVRFDAWEGGGGVPAIQRVAADLGDIRFVLPLLTPSGAAPTWIGDEWKRMVYDVAHARHIDVLPVHGDGDLHAVPGFLRDRSFADLRGRDYRFELRRLLHTLRERSGDPAIELPDDGPGVDGVHSPLAAMARPIVLEVGGELAGELQDGRTVSAFTDEAIPFMYDGLFYELGVHFPEFELRQTDDLPPLGARVLINDVPEIQVEARRDSILANDDVEAMAKLGIPAEGAVNPANGAPVAWISKDRMADVARQGLTTWTMHGFLILALSGVLRRKAADFLGVDEALALLALVEPVFPYLVAETVPKTVSPFVLTDVLRRLLAEGVCIRNLRRILMALADWGRVEHDPLLLTEYVRASLQRQICHQLSRGTNQLIVFLLDPEIEALVRDAMTHTATGSYVRLAPERLRAILQAIQEAKNRLPPNVQVPQVLTTMEIRSSIRRLVAPSMPELHAVSYQELRHDMEIQPVGRISLSGFSRRPGIKVGGVPIRE